MPYLGAVKPTETTSSVLRSTYTGDGSTTTFNLPGPVANETSIIATINGVTQQDAAYTTNGSQIIFSAAPSNGDAIEIRTISDVGMSYAPSTGSVTTGILADGAVTTGKINDAAVTAAKLGVGAAVSNIGARAITAAQVPAGSVIQVVNYIYTGQTTTTGDWIDTGLTVTITPSSASSKILVNVHQTGLSNDSTTSGVKLRLMRNSTTLVQFENGAAYQSGDNDVGGSGITYLDSPATTSATTYKTQFGKGAGSSGTAKVGHYGVSSGITVMEIAA